MNNCQLTLRDAFLIGREDAHGQASLVRSGQIPLAALTEAAILRIEHLNSKINAVTYQSYESARTRARTTRVSEDTPLAGTPYLLKESLEYPGMPSIAGSRSRSYMESTRSFPFSDRLDAQGLIPVGMSSMPEFGLLPSTEPLRHGPTRNPWNPESSAGGSSGGAGAAVAAGMVAIAHGSDAGGSIRVPASSCGIVGLKASRGANVRARAQNLVDDLLCSDVLLSRSVRDVAWSFNVTRPGSDPRNTIAPIERPLRIGVDLLGLDGTEPDPEVAAMIEKTADLCARVGHRIERVTMPVERPGLVAGFLVLLAYLAIGVVDDCRDRPPERNLEDLLEPWTLALANWGTQFGASDLEHAFAQLIDTRRALADFYRNLDVVLSPVTGTRPPQIGYLAPARPFEELRPSILKHVNYTKLQNVAGTPAISLPLFAAADTMPIGSMFAAAYGHDELLLALALQLEREQPWVSRWPACFLEAVR